MIPLGEKNGSLRFLTQAAVTLQKQFDQIEYRQADVRAELNGVLRSIFKPLPSARIAQVRPVTAGLRVAIGGGQSVSLEGEKEPIQIHVEFAPASSYDATRTERENDSRSSRERSNIYLLGRVEQDADQLAITLVRCRKFLDAHRSASDPDTQEFVRIVDGRLNRASDKLERKLAEALLQGSFVAHGAHEAVAGHGTDVLDAAKSFLGDAAAKVFDRYDEAAHQADSALAEKFLTTPLDRITSKEDPLAIVSRAGGKPQVKADHKAIISINDYLGQSGQVEGRRLLDHFSAPPFGWSKDTTRYLLAAAFLGGVIKLRIAGHDHQVTSDESLDAFKSNKAFGAVGVSLREEKPDPAALLRASERLRDLSGENIMPLEVDIAAAAKKHFPIYQAAFGPLAVDLRNLGLPVECSDRAEALKDDLTAVVSGDGSDAVKRFGGADSALHDDLVWARNLKKSLDNGLRTKLGHLQRLRRDIDGLPDSGVPAKLKADAAEAIAEVDEVLARSSFFDETAALAKHADALDKLIGSTVTEIAAQQEKLRLESLARWGDSTDWHDLDGDSRDWIGQEVGKLAKTVTQDADGLRDLLNHDYTLNHRLRELETKVSEQAADARSKRKAKQEEEKKSGEKGGEKIKEETLLLPVSLDSAQQIKNLIEQLSAHLAALEAGTPLRLTCQIIQETK
jgi:hypothetical protein